MECSPLGSCPPVAEKVRTTTFANLILTSGKFAAGVRYEAYLPPLQGFDQRYRGQGIPARSGARPDGPLKALSLPRSRVTARALTGLAGRAEGLAWDLGWGGD